jgi:protein-tyrosine phosphatase
LYLAWPDQSCPDIAQPLIGLVKNVEKSGVELTNMNKYSGPVVVHCRYIFFFVSNGKAHITYS